MPSQPHGDLDCTDTEALLTEAIAENADLRTEVDSLRSENADLRRRLDNAITTKQNAFDEVMLLRSRPEPAPTADLATA